MKNQIIQTEKGTLTSSKKYFIIQGNNGNHTGHNRKWEIFSYGFDTKKEANKEYKDAVNSNDDIKYGLTPLCIVTAQEIAEIINSDERLFVNNCFDVSLENNEE